MWSFQAKLRQKKWHSVNLESHGTLCQGKTLGWGGRGAEGSLTGRNGWVTLKTDQNQKCNLNDGEAPGFPVGMAACKDFMDS